MEHTLNYNDFRKKTKKLKVGNTYIGGDSNIAIQSMTNTDPHDLLATLNQVLSLQNAGCDIVRLTAPDMEAAHVIGKVRENPDVKIPLVADIHFDYRIALECAACGVDKIRINPGNIGDKDRVRAVVNACREKKIPIRIGVNGGSLEKEILAEFGAPTPKALAKSAMGHVKILEELDFTDIVISVKSSSVYNVIKANELLSDMCDYPLHIGITEGGGEKNGTLKASAVFGSLLMNGIGDTLRVSLTADPEKEIKCAKDILKSLGFAKSGINIISCPTCGRTKIDLFALESQFEKYAENLKTDKYITVAIMGCAVNGPGEASQADIGIAGGIGEYLLFKKGEIIGKVPADFALDALISETEKLIK